jgi:hypothetical protein
MGEQKSNIITTAVNTNWLEYDSAIPTYARAKHSNPWVKFNLQYLNIRKC